MLGLIKKTILSRKQNYIRRRFPDVSIVLHQDMPQPSIGKIAEVSRLVHAVNSFEPAMSSLTDDGLRRKSDEFRERLDKQAKVYQADLEEVIEAFASVAIPEEKERLRERLRDTRNRIFEGVLPEAFATVREVSRRTIGLRHFDVQIAGGIILHEGRIAEMATGEGKTLVATLPAYLNALLGKGVHIVTVNDYLARRDRDWMGPIYESLGLSVGVIQHEMSDEQRRQSYACDITYGTNNEFGFDYLRDNMKYSLQEFVQRPFFFAIVDEVDSILIDEARTPLIISGPAEESTDKYYTAHRIAAQLKGRRITEKDEIDAKYKGEDLSKGFDYLADEKAHTIALNEDGEAKAARHWGVESLHTVETMEYRHHIIQALRAKEFFRRDVDYVIKEGEVIIVDEFTGRMMPGRRWSDGLHQAVEAKEGLKIERENQTLATITLQNYFRMYEKLAGMTGTAYTEANEFKSIYKLDVVSIPTNRQLMRVNYPDRVYKTEKEKFGAAVEEIVQLHEQGRPVLVGTISIERSELLSEMLKRKGVTHQVLNAKYHEMEAQIVAQAGRFKAVTIATNMAGRGTDILLGGNPENMAKNIARQKLSSEDPAYAEQYRGVLEQCRREAQAEHEKVVSLGGLHVLGTERHEARRIDNQLRGRCGRQGDPGSSRFYVSLSDDLMRLFGSERIIGLMDTMGLEEGQVIEHGLVSRSIEIAQKRVEGHNFEIRKHLLEYDNVMNKQREIIYGQRRQVLEGVSLKEQILEYAERIVGDSLDKFLGENVNREDWDTRGFGESLRSAFGQETDDSFLKEAGRDEIRERIVAGLAAAYDEKEKAIGADVMRHLERMVFLQIIDGKWKDHLYAMDTLKEGIGLRAYGQRDPLVEYKREAFEYFSVMISTIEDEVAETLLKIQPVKPERFRGVFSSLGQEFVHSEAAQFEEPLSREAEGPAVAGVALPETRPSSSAAARTPKVGRNDPCPCGSGKKYKKCCGS